MARQVPLGNGNGWVKYDAKSLGGMGFPPTFQEVVDLVVVLAFFVVFAILALLHQHRKIAATGASQQGVLREAAGHLNPFTGDNLVQKYAPLLLYVLYIVATTLFGVHAVPVPDPVAPATTPIMVALGPVVGLLGKRLADVPNKHVV